MFNGAPNPNFYQNTRVFSSDKTIDARTFSRSFMHRTTEWLCGFGIGPARLRDNNGQHPMQSKTFGT